MQLAHIWIQHRTLHLNSTFTYLCEGFSLCPGLRVEVLFNHKKIVGFVAKVETSELSKEAWEEKEGYKLSSILHVLDIKPVLNEELFQLGLWLSKTTISPVIACFQTMLPRYLNPRDTTRRPVVELWVSRNRNVEVPDKYIDLVRSIEAADGMRFKDAKENFGTRIDTLVKKGILDKVELKPIGYELSANQVDVLDKIRKTDKATICLFGPTGAGKTEIYLRLAQEAIDKGMQALILVPEISLTPQMVKRVEDRFGQDVILYHSALNDNQRFQQYSRVLNGEAAVVVGTRSAIWLPFTKLNLIVLDEEHDNSYKQDMLPRYHCKDVAIRRALHFGCKVILGSATPSLDTFARAKRGVYALIELDARIAGILPEVKLIQPDARRQVATGIRDAIADRLGKGEQTLILLNRRGYSPVLQCVDCGHIEMCDDCDRPMSVHKEDDILKCHSCGITRPLINTCPSCGSAHLRMIGSGTQKVEEELRGLFPQARITRMDSDSTSRKNSHASLLEEFAQHRSDILLGTQMIAKGLDIPNVTLAVILGVDQALMRSDVRSVEETFALLVQAAGRSGRGEGKGEVLVQTHAIDHYAIVCAQKHDYLRFFAIEMRYRKLGQNPPYTYLIALEWTAQNHASALSEANIAKEILDNDERYRILGPVDLGKTKGSYRTRIILKGKDLDELRNKVWHLLETHEMKGDVEVGVDVNPFTLL
jgi:primosomal protein N' (replication factor Y)